MRGVVNEDIKIVDVHVIGGYELQSWTCRSVKELGTAWWWGRKMGGDRTTPPTIKNSALHTTAKGLRGWRRHTYLLI